MKKIIESSFILLMLMFGASIFYLGCNKDDETPETEKAPEISCSAGYSSMSWNILKESGPSNRTADCTRSYQGNKYVETCTGTVTFTTSGKSYTYKAVYDWVNSTISVTVNGLGSCSDGFGGTKSASCDCFDETNREPCTIVFFEEIE